eukprot:SM000013S26515  [mRNA]  locus=s13:790144:791770:+ [translate_table: standard]
MVLEAGPRPQIAATCIFVDIASDQEDLHLHALVGLSALPGQSPTELVEWGGTLPSGRRLLLGSLVGLSVAFGSNFLGVTSLVLSTNTALSRRLKLDVLFPIAGFKRCLDGSLGFEFMYPERWVGDQRLLYRAAERAERERSLDLPSIRKKEQGIRRAAVEPVVAFGPPGSAGELNVSVVVAPVARGFQLEAFGSAQQVGERVLNDVIAPKGSDKEAVLVQANRRGGNAGAATTYYVLEYTVQAPTFFRHNVSVYASYADNLYSFNAQCPEALWPDQRDSLTQAAQSFRLTANSLALALLPQQL